MKSWKLKEGGLNVLVLKETMIESMIADAWGYATLGLLFWFNYNYIGGSYMVNTIILIMMAVKIGKIWKGQKHYSIDEVIEILEELKPPTGDKP